MKKLNFLSGSAILACLLASCSLFGSSTPTLDTPTGLKAYGNVITWDAFNAKNSSNKPDRYEIFNAETGDSLGKTLKTGFVLDYDVARAGITVNVKAISDNESSVKSSNKSDTCSTESLPDMSKDPEKVSLTAKKSFYEVASTTSYVSVTQASTDAIEGRITIAERTSPLLVKIKDINLVGSAVDKAVTTLGSSLYSTKTADNPYTLIVVAEGSNTIVGSACSYVPAAKKADSNALGETGRTGFAGIMTSTLLLEGGGTLTVTGGQGGTGGAGAASSEGLLNPARAQNGGNGGAGGAGILAENFMMAMESTGVLVSAGGKGGAGGHFGSNGSILTGPGLVGSLKNGSTGADGTKLAVTTEYDLGGNIR